MSSHRKRAIIYGWRYANDPKRHMLFVYQKPGEWGVTKDPNQAARFGSAQECGAHFLSKCAFPCEYVSSLTNGYLHYFEWPTMQLILP